jgi:hypothetical protein
MMAPDVAVTVTVEVTGATALGGGLAGAVPEDLPLQPVIRVNATTLKGRSHINCRLRRWLPLPTLRTW